MRGADVCGVSVRVDQIYVVFAMCAASLFVGLLLGEVRAGGWGAGLCSRACVSGRALVRLRALVLARRSGWTLLQPE